MINLMFGDTTVPQGAGIFKHRTNINVTSGIQPLDQQQRL